MKQTQQQREIVEGLRAGDPDAWRSLFKEYASKLWHYVARRMQGRAAEGIQDVVQETMLAAARSAGNFDESAGTIWSWLRGIAHNQIALAYRNRARQDVLNRAADELQQTGGRLAAWLNDSSDLPEDLLARVETSELVRSALGRLPGDYSDLLTAKYLDEKSIEQIADENDTTVASVNSKLARARKAFRETFRSEND